MWAPTQAGDSSSPWFWVGFLGMFADSLVGGFLGGFLGMSADRLVGGFLGGFLGWVLGIFLA